MIGGRVRFGSEVDMAPILEAMGASLESFCAEFDVRVPDGENDTADTIARSLPSGVAVFAVDTTRSGVVVTSTIALSFDDVHKLHDLEMFYAPGQPSVRPFDGLQFIETKDVLELKGTPPRAPAGSPGTFLFEVELAALVLDSNATSVSPGKLSWAAAAGDATAMHARFALR